jgi:hypothetical protein
MLVMARVKNNIATEGLSGQVDRLIFKHYKNKTVVSKVPKMPDTWSEAQGANRNVFRMAQRWAGLLLRDPEMKEYYRSKATGLQNAYNAAMSEYYRLHNLGLTIEWPK